MPTFVAKDMELDKYNKAVFAGTFTFKEESSLSTKVVNMENAINQLMEGQKKLFDIINDKSWVASVEKANPRLHVTSVKRPYAEAAGADHRKHNLLEPPRKRANSVISVEDASENESEAPWETTREEKKREKAKERKQNGTKKPSRKPAPVVVGTGKSRDENSKNYQAAPKHVFISRTAKSTTKEIVEDCLKYFANIDGTAVCVTPEEYRETAHSLSWRVEVPAVDLKKCLEPDSWATGWAVRQFFFQRKRPL